MSKISNPSEWYYKENFNHQNLHDFASKYTTDTSVDRRLAVHCPTRKQARQLLRQAKRLGFEWFNKPARRTHWGKYRKDTAYVLIRFGTVISWSNIPVENKLLLGHVLDLSFQNFKIVEYNGEIV